MVKVIVRTGCWVGLVVVLATSGRAGWWRLLEEDFSVDPAVAWHYTGATNGSGQPLLRYDAAQQSIAGEWDQSRGYNGAGDPQSITPSVLSRPLGRVLTERDTFRLGASLRIQSGSVPDTMEFFQIACFGLYNLSTWGDDRAQSDNYSGNTTLVRDANDLLEFDYFINNDSFGFNPFVQGTLIGAMPEGAYDNTPYFVTGSGGDPLFHDTDMGAGHYLPAETNLYVELVYYGAATGQVARRVFCGVYTEPARTNLLTVNGVPMYYWTQPASSQVTFRLSHAAMVNWPSVNFTVLFGGSTPDGAGLGSYDDLYVDLYLEPARLIAMDRQPGGPVLGFATTPGRSYAVRESTNLPAGAWATAAVVVADAETMSWTNASSAGVGAFIIEELP